MNIIKHFSCLILILCTSYVCAQDKDDALVRINEDLIITKGEFEYAYKKDGANKKEQTESIDKFLENYINFKLTVKEARKNGFDKQKDFISEYSTYLEQVEKPYLIDSIIPDLYSKEIYERLKQNIEVSHLFLKLPATSILPKDTLNAYNKILNIRNSINNGNNSSFEELVLKYSEDSISKNSITPGYLGWKTAFSTRYPFEECMYNLPPNTISAPVRTTEGYHLIKILNKRPDPGQMNIAHIVLLYPDMRPTESDKDSIRQIASEIYDKLEAGEDFNKLSFEYSDDKETSSRGGNLGWFGVNRPIPPMFEEVWNNLTLPGQISEPIETYYGYHIFKLIDKTPLFPWERLKDGLIDAINESDRKQVLTKKQIDFLSKEYPYTINENVYSKLQDTADEYLLSDTLYFEKIHNLRDDELLNVQNNKYTVKDFIYFLEKNPHSDYLLSTDILKYKFNDFILDRLIESKRLDLPDKYPDLRYLTQEFYEGILFFNFMNEYIWQKSTSDKEALQKLYTTKYADYKWDEPRFKGYVIHTRDKKLKEEIETTIQKNKNAENLIFILNSQFNNDSVRNIIFENGLWAKGENDFVDRIIFNQSTETPREIIGYPETIVEGKLIQQPENLNDILGIVTADYQGILENQWYNSLRKKYSIVIDEKLLQEIKQGIKQ